MRTFREYMKLVKSGENISPNHREELEVMWLDGEYVKELAIMKGHLNQVMASPLWEVLSDE